MALSRRLILISGVSLLLVGIGYVGGMRAMDRQNSQSDQLSIDQNYQGHALKEPFVFQSQSWISGTSLDSHGHEEYIYVAPISASGAYAKIVEQLSGGGYQVNAAKPDSTTSLPISMYRDLLTGNLTMKVEISPDRSDPQASLASGPVQVIVKVAKLGQSL